MPPYCDTVDGPVVKVAKSMPIEEADKIAEEVRERISQEMGYQHCVIHVDPANNSPGQKMIA